MSHFEITGGVALHGEVRSSGAKNAALPIMAAAILASEPVRLEGVPRLADVRMQARVLKRLGLAVEWNGRPPMAGGADILVCHQPDDSPTIVADRNVCPTLWIETVDPTPVRAPEELIRRMRAGFCVLGPLLARRGRAIVPLPGGCNIGDRPVDLHLKGLAALGADIRFERGYVMATARRLIGTEIDLSGPHGPTVTGTANVISAAVLARGVTILRGTAIEPEIVDLGDFLVTLGAKIEGLGTRTIRIEGVDQLGGATHRLIPDRIEAATLLIAAAITGGSATITNVVPEHLAAVLEKLRAAGATIRVDADRVSIVASHGRLRATDIVAEPYPGVPTDIQAQWTALVSLAEGASRVEDRVFPTRFLHAAELNRLGAKIVCGAGAATVTGVDRLSGARVTAHDLRASAALLLAGLAADGQTIVDRIHHLDRGYQRLDHKLRRLGARIRRVVCSNESNDPKVTEHYHR
jgi:UDP-N-acetylglucosamine 1-carboxyvinyltransferase